MQKYIITLASALALIPSAQSARDDSCSNAYELFPSISAPRSAGANLLSINSDRVDAQKDRSYIFAGNVSANLDGQKMETDKVSYQPLKNLLTLRGTTNFQGNDIRVSGSSIYLNNKNKALNGNNIYYLIPSSKINGKADTIHRTSNVHSKLTNSTYSTCPVNQKIKDWHVSSAVTNLDHAKGWGTVKKAKLKIKDIPIIYVPKFSFALDDRRKSGFLFPHLEYKSRSGLGVYAPWYWNIAPNMDAIITPANFTKRGFWLGNEFRYLNHNFISELNIEGLQKDKLYNDEDRYFIGLKLKSHLDSKLSYGIDYSKLSDDDYIGDFKQSHFSNNTDFVDQYAFINYKETNWGLGARVQSFQSLVDKRERYRLLPRIEAYWRPLTHEFVNLTLSHQYSRFTHVDNTQIVGDRFNTEANLEFNLSGNAYFIKSGVNVQNTAYQNLENLLTTTSLNRTATTYYLDSGLFFEREFAGNNWLQTLEPRIYYAKRGKEDEDGFPDFDTSLNTFSYNNLFSHRLYSGKDLVGELDRISLGLTSKFIRLNNNRTSLQLKLAQGYDFITKDKTNSVFEGILNHQAWRGGIRAYTYPDNYELETLDTSLHYKPNNKLHLKTAYKFKNNKRKELDLAASWQVNPKLLVYARNRQSLLSTEKRNIESLLGFEYDSCCWAINLSAKRELTNTGTDEYDNSVHLSIELKGLTSKRDTKETLSEIFK